MIDAVGKRAIDAGLELGLFAALAKTARSPEGLAQTVGISVRGARSLLPFLGALGLLAEENGTFRLADQTEDFLTGWAAERSSIPDAADWVELTETIRTGQPARLPIEGEDDAGGFFTDVVGTLYALHRPLADHFAGHYSKQTKRILDLGAGSAVWSLALAESNPQAKVVAVDRARVLEESTTDFVTRAGAADRYELRAGSYHDVDLEVEHYGLVILGHIVHSEGWEASLKLLKRCFSALKPGGQLLISEWIAPETRSQDYSSALFDLNMLMFTQNGLVFTASELEELTQCAGFGGAEWTKGPGSYPLLLVKKIQS